MLAPSERYYLDRKRRPNKLTDRARQLLWMVKQWPPERSIVVVADSSFAALNLLAAVREQLCVVTPLHLDAALYDPAPARAPDTRGRPPLKGARQPTLKEVLASDTTFWRDATLSQWYGQANKTIEFATGTAAWYSATCLSCRCAGCWCASRATPSRGRPFCVPTWELGRNKYWPGSSLAGKSK